MMFDIPGQILRPIHGTAEFDIIADGPGVLQAYEGYTALEFRAKSSFSDSDAKKLIHLDVSKYIRKVAFEYNDKATNISVETLAELKNINELSVRGCPLMTSNCLAGLSLSSLTIAECPDFFASGYECLRRMQLRFLCMLQMPLSGEFFSVVRTMKAVEVLRLYLSEGITDDGVKQLRELPRLREIVLGGVEISSAAVRALASAPRMQKIVARGANLSSAELADIRTRWPQIQLLI